MAGRNGTGPLGMGPKTGRGLGRCGTEKFDDRRPRRLGYGRGYGLGCNRRLDGSEKSFLEDEKVILEERLEYINKALDTLENEEE